MPPFLFYFRFTKQFNIQRLCSDVLEFTTGDINNLHYIELIVIVFCSCGVRDLNSVKESERFAILLSQRATKIRQSRTQSDASFADPGS